MGSPEICVPRWIRHRQSPASYGIDSGRIAVETNPLLCAERLSIQSHGNDVAIPRDDPEAAAIGSSMPVHGTVTTKHRPDRPYVAGAIQIGITEIDIHPRCIVGLLPP